MIFKDHHKKVPERKLRRECKNYERQTGQKFGGGWDREQEDAAKIRRMQHDMKSHLIALLGMVQAEETGDAASYIRELLEDGIGNDGEDAAHCGNIVVDSLVNYAAALAKRKGITFVADIVLPCDLPFADRHLAIVLGNLLENALDACGEKKSGERYMKIQASYTKEILMITVRNSCEGKRDRDRDGHFRTTKQDAQNHGMGLSCVEQAAEIYHGQVTAEWEEESFQTVVVMYADTKHS